MRAVASGSYMLSEDSRSHAIYKLPQRARGSNPYARLGSASGKGHMGKFWRPSIWCALVLAGTGPANADQYRVCVGEYENNCPVSHDATFPCGTSPDDAARQLCTITDNNQRKTTPYKIIRQGSHDGNRCGYEWFMVICVGN